jgi:hypothetical protein
LGVERSQRGPLVVARVGERAWKRDSGTRAASSKMSRWAVKPRVVSAEAGRAMISLWLGRRRERGRLWMGAGLTARVWRNRRRRRRRMRDWRSEGAATRVVVRGWARAKWRALAAMTVVLPHWRVQLSRMLGSVASRSSAWMGSGWKWRCWRVHWDGEREEKTEEEAREEAEGQEAEEAAEEEEVEVSA